MWLAGATLLAAVFSAAVLTIDGAQKQDAPAPGQTQEQLRGEGIAKLIKAFRVRDEMRTTSDVSWMWARYGFTTCATSEFAQVAGTSFLRATVTRGGETYDTRATCENRQCIISGMTRKL